VRLKDDHYAGGGVKAVSLFVQQGILLWSLYRLPQRTSYSHPGRDDTKPGALFAFPYELKNLLNTSAALIPPKPKELERAASISCFFRAVSGT
jgi:hypothetical protein